MTTTAPQMLPGYTARMGEIMAARYLLDRTDHFRSALLVGDPGTGKTYFAECLARGLNAAHYFIPCHPWLTAEEVHQGVDIGAVAVGVEHADEAYLDGQLLKAVRESKHRDVVVTLDEVEKAGSRFYPLILDFLQNGRVHDARHRLHVGNPRNLFVVLTANEGADIPDAVKRRCFRVVMQFLPESVEIDVLRKTTGAPGGACRLVVAMATAIRNHGESKPSMQELRELLRSRHLATSVDEVDALIDAFLVKEPKDRSAVARSMAKPAAALFGEFRRVNA